MNFTILESCLRLIHPSGIENNTILEEITSKSFDLHNKYIVPFRKELDLNILTRSTPVEKNDLIIHYISNLIRVQFIMRDYKSIVFERPESFYEIKYNDQTGSNNIYQQYSVNRHALFSFLFKEIQKCCFNYKIPFYKLCLELDFQLGTIEFETPVDDSLSCSPKESEEQTNQSNSARIKKELLNFGFLKLTMTKDLSAIAVEKLIGFICQNQVPYQIAMFDHLGFIKHIEKEYGTSKKDLYNNLADILICTTRSIKANINVLLPYSKENRKRYTAYLYKDIVRKDYQKIK